MNMFRKFCQRFCPLFLLNFIYYLIKLSVRKENSVLCDLYFPKECKSTDKVLSTINEINTFLENRKLIDEKNRIEIYIKSIIFIDYKISTSWEDTGDILMFLTPSFSENVFYVLGILIWSSHCIEYQKKKSFPSHKINAESFKKLLSFFALLEKLGEDVKPIEKYFRETYPVLSKT